MTTPLALDLATLPVALAGAGPALVKRLTLLDAEQVPNLHIYAPDPTEEVEAAAGVRLIPLGQTDGQRVIERLVPQLTVSARKAAEASLDDLGGAALRSDIAAMRHETLYSRLFRS
jgi:urease accessory protein